MGLTHGLLKERMKVDSGIFLVPIGLVMVETYCLHVHVCY